MLFAVFVSQVPLRTLIPAKNVENLLVAGRCCGGDTISHAAMRNMMACTVTGQGAGVAAAVSLRESKNVSEFATYSAEIRQECERQGISLGHEPPTSKL